MKKYMLFLVLSILMVPGIIKAADCSNQTVSNYSKVLGNISYSYEYLETNGKVTFNIILTNVPKNFYVRDEYHDKYSVSNGTDMKFYSFKENETYKFEVFPDINACSTIETRYLYVMIPGYNPYYKDSVCDGVTDYQFCNRWFHNALSYKNFVAQVTTYKNRKKLSQEEEKVIKSDTISYIFSFYERYYMIILPIVIVSLIGYIIYHNRKDDSLISVK